MGALFSGAESQPIALEEHPQSPWGKLTSGPEQPHSAFRDPDSEKSGFKNHAPFKVKQGYLHL